MSFCKDVEDEADKINLKSNETWKRFYEKDYSYIVDNFNSQLLEITSCSECEYYTTNHDPIVVVSLELSKDCDSLLDCLNKYTSKSRLDENNKWKCDKCNNIIRPFKQTKLWKTSDVLIILLKRYNNNRKNNKFINYSLKLNLENISVNYSSKTNIYNLQCMGIHDGGVNSGHYYAICKNFLDKKWYIYNDEDVSEISEEKILSQNPYLFVYKRN